MTEPEQPRFVDSKGRIWTLRLRSKEELQRIDSESSWDARHAVAAATSSRRQLPLPDLLDHMLTATKKMLARLVEDERRERGVSEEDFLDSIADQDVHRSAVDALKQLHEIAAKESS
jgi:hypothetical protein